MSRVSLSRRLEALREAASRIDPRAVAVHRMPPALRQRYDNWRAVHSQRIAQLEVERGEGEAYAAIADGEDVLQPMPRPVACGLGLAGAPSVPDGATLQQLEAIWSEMIDC